nr:DUF924 family protein [Shewanella nanhaiensis]
MGDILTVNYLHKNKVDGGLVEQFITQWFSEYNKGEGVVRSSLSNQTQSHWEALLTDAKQGKLNDWQKTPPGRMSLILLLGPVAHLLADSDVTELNRRARDLCIQGVDLGFDTQLDLVQRRCFYDPLFYSSVAKDRELLLRLLEGMQSQAELPEKTVWSNWYAQASSLNS